MHFSNKEPKMKKYLTALCLLALTCSSSIAFANYLVVTADQITVTTEGMFVSIDGLQIEVQSLSTANNGYIVAIPQPSADICPNCGHDTYTQGGFCRRCGFPDDGKRELNKHAFAR